jgi:protein SCO1
VTRTLLLLLCCSAAVLAEPELPPQLRNIGIDQKLNTLIPLDLNVRDESGAQLKLGEYFGKRPVVLSFVYYKCPMLCDMVLNGMLRAFRAISLDPAKDFEIVTISFDPRETPALALAKKANYLEKYRRPSGAAGWHFLTADQDSIERLASAVGFRYRYDPKTDQFVHASGIMVLTPEGRLSRYFYGVEYPPRDLRLGIIEASERKIGNPVDRILLFCFHYDPSTGRYGLLITRIVRIAGTLTVFAMITGIVLLSRRKQS